MIPFKKLKLIFVLMIFVQFLNLGCSKKKIFREDPHTQSYKDYTDKFFQNLPNGIQQASFSFLNRDPNIDLALLYKSETGKPLVKVWVNENNLKFVPVKRTGWEGQIGDQINSMVVGDLDHDFSADVILAGKFSDGSIAKLLFNNGKGYFYSKHNVELPPLQNGIEKVSLVDLDGDGHRDLFFFGKRVTQDNGDMSDYSAQLFLNNGKGEFKDMTRLLLPTLPPGIVGTSFADYDGDASIDIFLVLGQGQNRLLLNNGHGKFQDRTNDLLPFIKDESLFADWADFDLDGDNDLLVVNKEIRESNRTFPNEYCYMLVNIGSGYFKKGPLKVLPQVPSKAVYLLDANDSEIPDAIILSEKGIHFLRGIGKWRFARESKKRLPKNVFFKGLTFGDVNGDSFLDIFGFSEKAGKGLLWINTFD